MNSDTVAWICKLGLISGFILFISYPAKAQRDSVAPDTLVFEELVFAGLRLESRLAKIPQSVSLMNSKKLEKGGYMSLPEAVSQIPGIWMQKTNHGGGSPYIRGLTGYQTLILIDGIRFNNSTFRSGPNQYLNTIDPYVLGRIEILRGAGSVQYGSDAIGGAVYLRTKKREFLQSGRELEVFPQLKWAGQGMELSGRAEINYIDSKNVVLSGFTWKDLGDIHAGGSIGRLDPTGYKEHSADIKMIRKLNEKNRLTWVYQHLTQKDLPLYHKISPEDYSIYDFDPQQRNLSYISHSYTAGRKMMNELRSTLSFQYSKEVRKKQKTGEALFTREEDRVQTLGLNTEIKSVFNRFWSASSGFELYADHINSKSEYSEGGNAGIQRGLYPDDSEAFNGSVYSLHKFEFQHLFINGGLRYSFFSLGVSDSIFGDTSVKPSALVGNLGASYGIFDNTFLTVSYSTAFRAPNINDVSSFGVADFRYEIPNFNLRPEYSTHYETGIKTSGKRHYLAAAIYRNELRDLIANVKTSYMGKDSIEGYKVYHRENLNKARIQGVELEAKYSLRSNLKMEGFLIYTLGENTLNSEPMRRIPPLFCQLRVEYHPLKNTGFTLAWLAAGKQERLSEGDKSDSRIAEGGTPAWNVFNIEFHFNTGRIGINGGLYNVLDEAYRIHGSGVDGQGRHLRLMAGYRF